jgi:hypothetical protein
VVDPVGEGVFGSNDVPARVESNELSVVVIVVLMSDQNKVGMGLVTNSTKRVNENDFSAIGSEPKRSVSLIE